VSCPQRCCQAPSSSLHNSSTAGGVALAARIRPLLWARATMMMATTGICALSRPGSSASAPTTRKPEASSVAHMRATAMPG